MEEILRGYIVLLWSYIFEGIDVLHWVVSLTEVVVYTVFSFGIVYIFKSTIVSWLRKTIENTDWSVGKYFMENHFFSRLVQLVPMVFLFNLVDNLEHDFVNEVAAKSLNIVFVILISLVLFSLVNSFEKVVENHKRMKEQSFKPFFQLFKVLILSLSLIFIYSGLTGKSPTTVLTMLGAVSAVLLLIFQDTIRNFVAYIQIVSLKLFRKGDWIVLKEYGADGMLLV